MKMVLIEWRDAVTPDHGGWIEKDDIVKWRNGSKCYSMGFVLEETPAAISIAASYTTNTNEEDPETFSGSFVIPRSMIKSVRRLR